jgi:hypothetical protein
MASLAYLLAVFLDPVQAALVLAAVLVYRGPHPVFVAGAVAAAVSETIMVASGYAWGEFVLPRLAACLMQAAVLNWLVRAILRAGEAGGAARRALAWLGIDWFPTKPATAGARPQHRSQAQRLAPWNMRAYVRRRLYRLLQR